jgi:hypothetical protein
MSAVTQATDAATPATVDMGQRPVPMYRLVQVELRKMVDTRAGFWLFVSIGLASALITGGMLIFGEAQNLTFGQMFGMMNIPTGFLLPVLAILLVTSEWSQRTGLATFTLEPRRSRVVVAKLATSLIAAVAAVAIALAFGAVGNLLAEAFRDGAGGWDMTWAGLRNSALIQFLALLQGFAFGMLIMNSAAAIVLFFVLPTVWTVIASIVPWLAEHVQAWADLTMAQGPLQSGTSPTGEEWARLAVAATIWVLAPLAVGVWRLLRSEVK